MNKIFSVNMNVRTLFIAPSIVPLKGFLRNIRSVTYSFYKMIYKCSYYIYRTGKMIFDNILNAISYAPHILLMTAEVNESQLP